MLEEIIPNPNLYTSDHFKVVDFSPSYWQAENGEVFYSDTKFIPYSSKYKEFPFNPSCSNITNLPIGTLLNVYTDINGIEWHCYNNEGNRDLWMRKSENMIQMDGPFYGNFYISSGKYLCFIVEGVLLAYEYKNNQLILHREVELSAYDYSDDVITCLDQTGEIVVI